MNLALPDHLVQPITSALRYGIADLQQAVTRDSPEVQQTINEWSKALALVARIQPVEDSVRLDKLAAYLSDHTKNISGPFNGDTSWEFGYNAGPAYHIDSHAPTLREAIDQLP